MQRALNERTVRIGWVAVAVVLAGCLANAAQAQTIDVNTPVSVPVAGNADRLRIVPVLTTVYDSNIQRISDQRSTGPRDNFRISPGLAIGLNRVFGRTRFALGGTAGYDFNTRFGGLDRERINLTSSVTTPLGSPCSVTGTAAYARAQFDLSDTDVPVSASYQQQTYDLSAGCSRVAGFYPTAGVSYNSLVNSARALLNSNQFGIRAGVGYARPSLGTLQLVGSVSKIDRPGINDLLGIDDSTTVGDVQIVLTRAVAPRVKFQIGAGITHANPARAEVPSFTGLSFDGEVTIRPVPRFGITLAARRAVQNQSGYSTTYTILDTYRIGTSYQLSARSAATLFLQRLHRDPRGQDLAQLIQPRGEDTLMVAGGNYSFDFHKTLRLTLSLVHRRRTADNDFYDYEATSASAGVSARF